MAAPFKIVGIDHVVLRAADPAALVEQFYLDVLGLSFETRQDKLAQLRAGQALIDIVRAEYAGPAGSPSSTGANLDHLCLRIEPFDAAAIAKHLATQGITCGAETLRLVPRVKACRSIWKIRKATELSSRDRPRAVAARHDPAR